MSEHTPDDDWPFEDEKRVAVFTVRSILEGEKPILLVTHDEDDGSWQFHDGSDHSFEEDGRIIALEEALRIEPAIAQLADLPLGWIAWRERPGSPWRRQRDSHNE